MAKSAGNFGLVTFTEEILNGKLHTEVDVGYFSAFVTEWRGTSPE